MASVLWVCFDRHRRDGLVVAVRVANRWHMAARVELIGHFESVYRGPRARQPRFYFRGYGSIRRATRGTLVVMSLPKES